MAWEKFEVENQIEINAFYSLFERSCPKGWNYDGESHDFWECVYVIEGNIFASGDGRIYNLSQGEMIFHKPMEFHKLWVDSEKGAHVFIFSFSAEGELLNFFREKVLRLSKSEKKIVQEMLEFMRKAHDGIEFEDLPLERKYIVTLGNNSGYLQSIVSYVNLLLLSLWGTKNTAETEGTTEAQIFYDTVEFMHSNISGNLSIEELAKHSKTSASTLKRLFAKYAGISIHRYFLNLKVNMGTEFLRNGKSVTETAQMLGFSSQAHLSKVYKNITGESPSKLRRDNNQ